MSISEEKRKQLDGIVQQMIQNKEKDDDIQMVVNDFVSKYTQETEQLQPQKDKPFAFSVDPATLKRTPAINAQIKARLQSQLASAQKEEKKANSPLGFLGNFAKSAGEQIAAPTIAFGKTIGKAMSKSGSINEIAKSNERLFNDNIAFIRAIKKGEAEGKDTTKIKQAYNSNLKMIADNNKRLGIEESEIPTTGQIVGQAGGVALDAATAGTYGKAAQGLKTLRLGGKTSAVKKAATALSPELGKLSEQAAKGLFTKTGAKNIAKGAGIGYGFDVSQNLQEGKTGGEAFKPGLGTLIGGGIPAVSETAESLRKGSRVIKDSLFGRPPKNIDDVVKIADEALKTKTTPASILARTEESTAKPSLLQRWANLSNDIKNRISGKKDQLKEYLDVVHARNNYDTLPTGLEYGNKKVEKATKIMEDRLNDTGGQIGSFRRKIGTYQADIDQTSKIENTFKEELSKLNLEIKNGSIKQKAGTLTRVGAKNDIGVLQDLYDNLRIVKQNPNLEKLIDLRNLFDNKINFEKRARDISNSLDPVSRNMRSKIADVGKEIVGNLEAGNLKEYSEFMDGYNELRSFTDRKAGAEFLLKQVLSERGRTPREVMNTIRKFTGIDLMDDAVMASIATDLVGNARQKGLFRQEITKAGLDVSSILKGDSQGAIDLMFTFIKKGLVNREKQFLKAAETPKKGLSIFRR